ncbi:MAG: hypothetical protein P1U63_07550 [Coxiellaceae bacterium]|nr:hypothetical protein [Coxiellaceae bacterium]
MKAKVDKLFEEITNKSIQTSLTVPSDAKAINASNLFSLLHDVNDQLSSIMVILKISSTHSRFSADGSKEQVNLYNQLLALNQSINELLEMKTLPADNYQINTLSVYYAGEILSAKNISAISLKPRSKYLDKTPADVFNLQLKLLGKLNVLGSKLGVKMLSLKKTPCNLDITPAVIQGVSYIILSEVMHLAHISGVNTSVIKSYYPNKKYPSDVFERGEMLLHQINAMIDSSMVTSKKNK